VAKARKLAPANKAVEALTYPESRRKHILTAKFQVVLAEADEQVRAAYERHPAKGDSAQVTAK